MNTARETFVAMAQRYIGAVQGDARHKEIIDAYNTLKPLPRKHKMTYTDEWCAAFVTAMGVLTGLTPNIILPECSCNTMIELYKAIGRWQENDAHVPKPGDLLMYDWQDDGKGDNTGVADHVGIVEKVVGNTITIIEGNRSKRVMRTEIAVNGKTIRGYCLPDFEEMQQIETIHINGYTAVEKIPFSAIDKVDFALCKQPTETLANYYNRQTVKPDVLVNGGFFNPVNDETMFNLIDELKTVSYDAERRLGFGITTDGKLKYGDVTQGNYRDFLSGYPCLITDGKKTNIDYASSIAGKNPRTAIGYNDTHLFIMTVDGRQTNKLGANFLDMQNWFLQIDAKYAINLDGGGSTRKLINGKLANSPTENRAVDNVVAVYLKKTETTPSPEPAGKTYKVINVTTVLNVRAGAGTQYKIVGSLQNNEVVTVYNTSNGWAQLDSNRWCSMSYLQAATQATGTPYKVVNVNTVLNVRNGAGTKYSVVGSLKNSTIVNVETTLGGWARIGTNKWCSLTYLKKI